MSVSSAKSYGFTVVELIVAITVMTILAGIVFGILGDFFYDNLRSTNTSTQDTDVRTALRRIESEVSSSFVFLDTANVTYSEFGPTHVAGGSGADLTWTGGTDTLLIKSYATNTAGTMVALTDNSGDCTPAGANPMENLVIYFVKDNTLYRRTVVNWDNQTPCSGYDPSLSQTAQKSSCLPTATQTTRCKSTDAVLLRNVSSFAVSYYANPTATTTTTDILTAQTVGITVETTANQVVSTANIRINLGSS